MRVLHLPVNLAGTGWAHVNALRRKGVDARLLVFRPQRWRPDEYDINLNLPRNAFWRGQLIQFRDHVGGFVTVHPSYILRLRDDDKDEEYRRLVADLSRVHELLPEAAK